MKNCRSIYLLAAFLLTGTFALYAQTETLVGVNFATSCSAPPAGWTIVNVDGSCTWRCESGGITQNNHTSAGCVNAANDWLITPVLALNRYKNEVLNFTTTSQYNGPTPTVKYSTNYPGTGNPTLYTWLPLSATFPGASGNVSLAGIAGDSVYIAFHYTSNGNATNQAARWTITEVSIKGDKSVSISNPTSRNITSSSAILGAEIEDDGGLTITERGMLWSTSATPTLATANKVTRAGGIGVYDTLATGLPAGTRIYYRGYARTATEDFYTGISSFYTLSDEPVLHATAFTATANSSSSMVLNWTASATATGYLVLQKAYTDLNGLPADATAYTETETIGDAVVARVIASNTVTTDTIRNLLSGTRYYFKLVPFGVNGAVTAATYNYLTAPVIPAGNDSTWGVPASSLSDLTGVAGSEADAIPSVENTTAITADTDGKAVWKLAFRDGGAAMNDADALPTIFTGFTLTPGSGNTAVWNTMIQSVALFDDSTGTKLATGTVSAIGISFSAIQIRANDDNFKTATIRLSLNKNTSLKEHTVFQFMIRDTSVKLQSAVFSSQQQPYVVVSDAAKNKISVSASRIRIITQPPALAEAGVAISQVVADLVDVWNNTDMDTTLAITLSSVQNNMLNGAVSRVPVDGRAVFAGVIFNRALATDTLLFEAGDLAALKSIKVKVKNTSASDIAATPGFVYTTEIPYASYQDSTALDLNNSIAVFGFTLRDGGSSFNDPDSAETALTSVRLSLTNYDQVKTLALFDSLQHKLAEVYVTSGTIDFSGLDVIAPDNGRHHLEIRATFKSQVIDRTRIQFKITNVTGKADTLVSQFGAVDGGGANSSAVAAENRLAVTATQLRMIVQPVLAKVHEVIDPAITLSALDNLGNIDRDNRIITISAVRGTLSPATTLQAAVAPSSGIATFSGVVFNDTISGTQLRFSDGSIEVLTDSFDVTTPMWFRSAQTGDWDSASTWEYSADTGITWQASLTEFPDAVSHGRIVIREGHTVTMRGSTNASVTIDETVVEKNAVLVTPLASGKALKVNNGRNTDLAVYGTLRQVNNTLVKGISIQPGASVVVMPGGMIELAATGYARDWAADPAITYQDSAVYFHNTTHAGSIEPATYFPGATAGEKAVFRVGANYELNNAGEYVINGIVDVVTNKIVSLHAGTTLNSRNGISGNGTIAADGNAKILLSGKAILSGNGTLALNGDAIFTVSAASYTSLANHKTITTNNGRTLDVAGTLDVNQYEIRGNAGTKLLGRATAVTKHALGVKALYAGTGSLFTGSQATFIFNGNALQHASFPADVTAGTLVVANPFGVSVNQIIHIADTLNLQQGPLFTQSNGTVAVNEQTRIINYNLDRFIGGKVNASMHSGIFLPLGKAGIYAPVTIENESGDAAEYEVEYSNGLLQQAPLAGTLTRLSGADAWSITRVSGVVAARFTVTHQTLLTGSETPADIRLVRLTNGAYEAVGPLRRNATTTQLTSSYLDEFGTFAIALDSACVTPAIPVVLHDTVCFGTQATLQNAVPQAGTLTWYASATREKELYAGDVFTTGPLTSDTAFFVEARQLSCASSRIKVSVTVAAPLQQPALEAVPVICTNTAAVLHANGNNVKWFTDAALLNEVAEGNAFTTGIIQKDTQFYAASYQYGCLSQPLAIVLLTKAAPVRPFVSDVAVCRGNDAVLAASSNAAQLNWYVAMSAGQVIASGNYLALAKPGTDTAFYVEAANGTCTSERVKVQLIVKEVPQAPEITTQGYACKGSPVTLHASGNDSIRWYVSETDTLPAYTGNTITTDPVFHHTLFFVDAVKGLCSSPRLTYPVSVVEPPADFVIRTARSVRQYDSVKVTAEGNAANQYTWNFGPDAQPSVATGNGPHYVKWTSAGVKQIRLTASNSVGTFRCEMQYDTVITVTPSTGLSERNASLQSSVYPNPVKDMLHVQLPAVHGEVTLTLTDASGRILRSERTSISSYEMNLSGISEGMYFLYLEAGGKKAIHKLVIRK